MGLPQLMVGAVLRMVQIKKFAVLHIWEDFESVKELIYKETNSDIQH